MADQKRWFKVWTSIIANAHFAEMSLEDIGRWTLLGAATALDGDRGKLEVPGEGKELCRILRVTDLEWAQKTLSRMRSVTLEKRDGKHVVTWRNWHKYQSDGTAQQRMKTLRSKKRGEEKREEEKEQAAQTTRRPPSTAAHKLYEAWLAAGYTGKWSTKEWVQANNGIKLLLGSESDALASFKGFLAERSEFYSGHYPSKWAREPAKWLIKQTPVVMDVSHIGPDETLELARKRYAEKIKSSGPTRDKEPQAVSEIARNVGVLKNIIRPGES